VTAPLLCLAIEIEWCVELTAVTVQEIADILKAACPDAVGEVVVDGPHPHIVVAAAAWPAVARFLRDDPRLVFNLLRCLSAVDLLPEPQLELVYDLLSVRPPEAADAGAAGGRTAAYWRAGGTLAVKVRVPRDGARLGSVAAVWPAAEWHEREAYDLLGVTFAGHPDPRRILCPDDWAGHPLRKDYAFPKEYDGIPAEVTK
jgi:NADH-quinone oxidoreductase subunit C